MTELPQLDSSYEKNQRVEDRVAGNQIDWEEKNTKIGACFDKYTTIALPYHCGE